MASAIHTIDIVFIFNKPAFTLGAFIVQGTNYICASPYCLTCLGLSPGRKFAHRRDFADGTYVGYVSMVQPSDRFRHQFYSPRNKPAFTKKPVGMELPSAGALVGGLIRIFLSAYSNHSRIVPF